MNVTERLARFVAGTRLGDIPAEARQQARRCVLDTLACVLAGCGEEAGRLVAGWVGEQGGAAEASVLGYAFRAPAAEAALANGVAGHALDYDDVSMSMRGHPSVPLLPALLALGEKLGGSGRQVSEALVLGFEVECRLGRAIGGAHYSLGWHATSTLGTLGAAAGCARLLGLDAEGTRRALGIAASLAAGVRQNFGTMTKPLQAGWAARNGVVAASLAARGLSADAQALEGPSGFLRAASGGADIDLTALASPGQPWEIVWPGIGVKLYPCCYATHRAIDAALELRQEHAIEAARVQRIEARVSRGTLMPLRGGPPSSGLEGKFSLEYCLAAAVLDGRVGVDTFSDEAVRRPEAAALMRKVSVAEDAREMAFPIEGFAEVRVVMAAGRALETRVDAPRGDPRRPLTWEELAAKFRDCASVVLPPSAIDEAVAAVARLEELADVSELVGVLAAAAARS